MDLKAHWERVFETKSPDAMSWTQALPSISLRFIAQAGLARGARLLDVGAGLGNLAVAL
jgi:2-polyprenyl-3-methyl-5-hydroxy-6-metoxy-1,4-benzoquinol methylase